MINFLPLTLNLKQARHRHGCSGYNRLFKHKISKSKLRSWYYSMDFLFCVQTFWV